MGLCIFCGKENHPEEEGVSFLHADWKVRILIPRNYCNQRIFVKSEKGKRNQLVNLTSWGMTRRRSAARIHGQLKYRHYALVFFSEKKMHTFKVMQIVGSLGKAICKIPANA